MEKVYDNSFVFIGMLENITKLEVEVIVSLELIRFSFIASVGKFKFKNSYDFYKDVLTPNKH